MNYKDYPKRVVEDIVRTQASNRSIPIAIKNCGFKLTDR